MIPLLLKPKLLALGNRWRRAKVSKGSIIRDVTILTFAALIMAGIYFGTFLGLVKVQEFTTLAYLPPFVPLATTFMVLMAMLFVTSAVTALGTLYLGKDLDFLLSAPLSPARFFFGKYIYVLFSTSWMPITFIGPFILAYGHAYNVPISYYVVALLVVVPYFLIPAALAVVLSTAYAALFPANRTREIVVLIVALFLWAIYTLGELVGWGVANRNEISQILRILSSISFPDALWLPSHWVATVLGNFIELEGAVALDQITLLYLTATASIALAFMMVSVFHNFAYTKAHNNKRCIGVPSKLGRKVSSLVLSVFVPEYRSIVVKEYKIFIREITQAVQLLLLVGVYLIYLYNLRIFQGLDMLPVELRVFWQRLLFITNVAMGAFVAIAVCSRLVFPSLSLEGRSYWILRSAPLSITQIMKAKFWCWFLSVGLVSSIVFASGAGAIRTGAWGVMINFLA
ncbi:hypothetical protein OAO01_06795, partial [Oligoflexia bacterium]|nr:hypothetical protein [Oligoflexia bacterium]